MSKKRKSKSKAKPDEGNTAVLTPPKPPITQIERSEDQCDRCSAKIEVKGERLLQCSRSRLYDIVNYAACRPDWVTEINQQLKGQKDREFRCTLHAWQLERLKPILCRFCRRCSVDIIRAMVKGRSLNEIISIVVSTGDCLDAFFPSVGQTGVRPCGQSGRGMIMVRKHHDSYLFVYSDQDAGAYNAYKYSPKTDNVEGLNGSNRNTIDKAVEAELGDLVLETGLTLKERMDWRILMKLPNLSSKEVATLQEAEDKRNNKGKSAVISAKAVMPPDDDEEELDLELFEEEEEAG